MSFEIALEVILVVLNIGTFFLHGTGIYLLICYFRLKKASVQHIYILNLSITIISFKILWLFVDTTTLLSLEEGDEDIIREIRHYVVTVVDSLIPLVYSLTMMYITTDRLLACSWVTKYPVYWRSTKAKYLLVGTWSVSTLLCLIRVLVYTITGIDCMRLFYTYLFIFLVRSFSFRVSVHIWYGSKDKTILYTM